MLGLSPRKGQRNHTIFWVYVLQTAERYIILARVFMGPSNGGMAAYYYIALMSDTVVEKADD